MPRRPRPVSRRVLPNITDQKRQVKPTSSISKPSSKLPSVQQDDTSSSDSDSEDVSEMDDGDSKNALAAHLSPDEDDDVDAPRVAQWVDEDDLDEWSYSNEPSNKNYDRETSSDEDEAEHSNLTSLQNDLAAIPLGALRKAQRELAQTQVEDDDVSENETNPESEPESILEPQVKRADKPEWSAKPRTDIPKRKDKNAPTEVTSKKPVTRRRPIIDVPKTEARDPRFLPFTGQLKPEKYRKQYEFLTDMHVTEMQTLKDHLKRAKKLLASSPQHLREEREQEVERLELAFKRTESSVHRDKREQVEQEALANAKKEESDKRKAGKGAWYMKDTDKKRLLIRARYDALAAEGGKGAVRKAIEKKQRKVGQKEKKRRPYSSGGGESRKRQHGGDEGREFKSRKRQKVG